MTNKEDTLSSILSHRGRGQDFLIGYFAERHVSRMKCPEKTTLSFVNRGQGELGVKAINQLNHNPTRPPLNIRGGVWGEGADGFALF
jgi:hypothetical protein